jgi:hypothetical protein
VGFNIFTHELHKDGRNAQVFIEEDTIYIFDVLSGWKYIRGNYKLLYRKSATESSPCNLKSQLIWTEAVLMRKASKCLQLTLMMAHSLGTQ